MSLEKKSVAELRNHLGVSGRAIRKWVYEGKIDDEYFDYRGTDGPGRSNLFIDPAGLPGDHRHAWVLAQIEAGELPDPGDEETRSWEWTSAADWRKAEARRRYRFYQAVPEDLSTEEKKAAIERYGDSTPAEEQPGSGTTTSTSLSSWYRYRKAYREGGLAGLMPAPRPSGDTKVTETDYERFKELYLTRDRRSARECWRRVLGAAREEGRGDDFPCKDTFVRLIKTREGEDVITITREGLEEYQQKESPYISRDWSTVPAGYAWFSDHRLFDIFVVDERTGEVGRPWFTPWMDARSTYFLSHDVYLDHPNSDRIFLSFKRAVESYGRPRVAYIDNGKDYRTLDFAGTPKRERAASDQVEPDVDELNVESTLDLLNVKATFARPYNARAKLIERKFQAFIEGMEKFSRAYAGNAPHRRPEKTEELRKRAKENPEAAIANEWLPTLSEFRERVEDWTERINRTPSDGRILGGHSPKEIFFSEHGKERRVDPNHLGILCLRTSRPRQIRRCELKDTALGVTYTADWMHEPRVSGVKAFAKRDPQDPSIAWIFRAETGELMGTAEKKTEVKAIIEDGDDEEKEKLDEEIRRMQEYVEGLKQKKREIEESQPSEEEMDAWFDAYLDYREEQRRQDGTYKAESEGGPTNVEHEEHELAQQWLDQAEAQKDAATDDLPYDPGTRLEDDPDDESGDDLKMWPDEE